MKQQDRLEEREQDIEEQLYKLESDKRLVEVTGPAPRPAPRGSGVGSEVVMGKDLDPAESQGSGAAKGLTAAIPQEKVSQLKDEVRLQYEKMHQILDEDLRKTMEILDKAQAKFCNENAAQVLHLNERMQEAKKLLSSVQVMFDKTEDINFMKVRTLCWDGRWPWARFGGGEAWLTMRDWGRWSGGAANICSGFSGAQWDWCRGYKRGLGLSAPPGPSQICGHPDGEGGGMPKDQVALPPPGPLLALVCLPGV